MKTQNMNRSHARRSSGRSRYLLLAMTIASVLAGTGHATSYVFTNIADSNGIFAPTTSNFSGIGTGFLSMNNFGVVAFSTGLDDGGRGVFKGSGGAITPIALSSGPVFSGLNGASLNDAGTVAFSAGFDTGGSGVFTGNGGPTTTIATTSEGFTVFGIPMMNNTGRVAFGAGLGGNSGLFLRGNGPAATVALESGPIFSSLSGYAINSSGTVAFHAALESGAIGVFTGNGGPITTIGIAQTPGGIGPSINDSGMVAFSVDPIGADLSVAAQILIGNGGPIVTYVSNAGPFSAFGIYPIINNFGLVAFLGGLDSTGQAGIFTGPDATTDKVILTGETLFGSTLTSLASSGVEHPGIIDLNDSGQIAFHYQLADGRQGIAVGTPIPEPEIAIALLMGAAVFCGRRLMRRTLVRLCLSFCGITRVLLPRFGIVMCFAGTAQAVPYIFTNIADSNGIFAPSGGPGPGVGIGSGFLSINNFGVVAFSCSLDDGSNGVFKGNGGPITSIALSSGPVFSLVAGGSINSAGTVAFVGQLDAGGSGIFTGNGGSLTAIATTSQGFAAFGPPRMNDDARIVFGASLGGGNNGIFLRGAGPATTVALESGPTFSSLGDSSVNAFGTVAFHAALESGSTGVFTGSGGPITTIGLAQTPGGNTPSINDLGTVVFAADPIGADLSVAARILLGNGGPIMTYVSNAGPFSAFGIYPIVNNFGMVAFLGGLDSTGQGGIFAGPDPGADKVILTGESLFGSVLTSVAPTSTEHPGTIDLNDSGQIAFHYQLADGRQGIAVATPVAEPRSAAALIMGAVLLSLKRWKYGRCKTAESNQETI